MKEFGLEEFLAYIGIEKKYSAHTLKSYSGDLRDFISYCTQKMGLDSLGSMTHFHIRSWIAELVNQKLEHTSINRKISCLKSYFKFLKSSSKISHNPMRKIVSPKNKKTLPKFVKSEELISLIENSDKSEDAEYMNIVGSFAVSILYQTGMRSAELLNIKISDINYSRSTIKVVGKGSKQRIIPLSNELCQEIRRYIIIRSKLELIQSDHLILTAKGRKPYPKLLYNMVQQELRFSTHSEKKSPHVLRHSFATHMADNGAEIKAIQDLLGHSSLSATQVYTHNSIQKLKDAYNKAHPKAIR
ncbi:MAG: tyrosine-type recombinase/integrase [Saprospiraceae bacterium]|nr:tyrosine-type recombinase/integrase [Saprospiraceae bacterium]